MRFVRTLNFSICLSLLLLSASTSTISAQLTRDEFLKQLTAIATLSENDLTSLRSGNMLLKVLPSRDKREVSVFGVVRLREIQNIDLSGFRVALSQKNNKAMLGGGPLPAEASLQDLSGLTVDDRDIEGIKDCVIGNCDLKLSAAMIRRFREEVDWSSAEQKVQATELFKTMLVDYTRDYLKRGDRALIEYADKRKPVRLADEYRVMMEGTTLVRIFAPELLEYLRKFPATELPGAESRVDWSIVDSGLKPIVTLTHSVGYSRRSKDAQFLTIATKQIYASHYLDASLAFASLFRFGAGESAEEYLVLTSISRSDALGGALSGMAHAVVEREALQKTEELLQNSRMRLESKPRSTQEPMNETADGGILFNILELSQNPTARIFALVIGAALALLIGFRWKARK